MTLLSENFEMIGRAERDALLAIRDAASALIRELNLEYPSEQYSVDVAIAGLTDALAAYRLIRGEEA